MNDKQTKINIGKEGVSSILERFNKVYKCLHEANSNPSILLTETIFFNELDLDFFMNNIILLFGYEAFDEFQSDFSNSVINIIKDKIPYNEIIFNVNINENNYYYIIISTLIGEKIHPLLHIDPYLKYIYIAENEEINQILNQIKLLEDKIEELEDFVDKLELSKENPIHLAGDNSLKMIDMLIRKKKYANEIQKESIHTIDTIHQYQNQIANYKSLLSEIEIDRTRCSILSDKYINRLVKYFNFKLIDNNLYKENNVSYKSYNDLDFSQLDFSNNP